MLHCEVHKIFFKAGVIFVKVLLRAYLKFGIVDGIVPRIVEGVTKGTAIGTAIGTDESMVWSVEGIVEGITKGITKGINEDTARRRDIFIKTWIFDVAATSFCSIINFNFLYIIVLHLLYPSAYGKLQNYPLP